MLSLKTVLPDAKLGKGVISPPRAQPVVGPGLAVPSLCLRDA